MVFVDVARQPIMAAQKPKMLKLSSVTEVRSMPPTIGTREAHMRHSKCLLQTSHCRITAWHETSLWEDDTTVQHTITSRRWNGEWGQETAHDEGTCGCRCERFDRLHEGDWNVAQAHISQHNVYAENKWHWKYPFPTVLRFNFNQWFGLKHMDRNICANWRAYEVDAGHGERKLEIQFLQGKKKASSVTKDADFHQRLLLHANIPKNSWMQISSEFQSEQTTKNIIMWLTWCTL